MSEEDFLKRWSRRKSEARGDVPSQVAEPPDEGQQASAPAAAEGSAAEPQIDLSLLPSIDSITAATDIRAFLRKGIPQELARAALRRAWTADPAIRDFIGLAENAWDFNDPNAMPGFGPLECSAAELGRLVDRVVGGGRKVEQDLVKALINPTNIEENSVLSQSSESLPEDLADQRMADQAAPFETRPDHVAPQPQVTDQADPVQRRKHGGALPQ